MHMFGYGYGGWGIGMFVMIVFCVAVIVGVAFWVLKTVRENGMTRNDAIQLLEERFAKGEISETEYIEKRDVLKR